MPAILAPDDMLRIVLFGYLVAHTADDDKDDDEEVSFQFVLGGAAINVGMPFRRPQQF